MELTASSGISMELTALSGILMELTALSGVLMELTALSGISMELPFCSRSVWSAIRSYVLEILPIRNACYGYNATVLMLLLLLL